MWPGIISWQEAWLAPRENDRADEARESKSTQTPKQLTLDHMSTHTKDRGHDTVGF